MSGWKNCPHGWRKNCYQCTPTYLALQAEQMRLYAECLMYDADALLIGKTFDDPNHRKYFLEDDKEIMILKGKYNV